MKKRQKGSSLRFMDRILLIGAGGHAKACIDVIEKENKCMIAGLVEREGNEKGEILGYSIIGSDKDLSDIRTKYEYAFIAIGHIKTAAPRIKVFKLLQSHQFNLPIIQSPISYVSDHATVGKGTIIMHGAIVNAGAEIGSNCIINSRALVEHDAKIGNHSHIATGSIVNGGAHVGEGVFIGSGSIIRETITVGDRCTISAGTFVKHDLPNYIPVEK